MSTPAPWRTRPDHVRWLQEQLIRQLDFGRGVIHPDGGAGWMQASGEPDLARPVFTWVTARMVHVYALGALAGVPGCAPLATQALAGLTGRLRDAEHGGWFASVGPGEERDTSKQAYTHAFVLLAASSAQVAGISGATALLAEVADVLERRFLDRSSGLYADRWDRAFTELAPYRGVNANMHGVEACLAAADATGDDAFLQRALTVTTRVVEDWARGHDWRVPEHFDPDWRPLPDHHRDEPDHPFEPYGVTVGHGLEWSRLVLHVRAALGERAPEWMLPAAEGLFARAVEDGWSADGTEGFVYTTDWDGSPVVRQRMHWVVAEGLCAAAALHAATGDAAYDEHYRRWSDHAATWWIDPADGSWQHQRDEELRPADSVWPGRPDLYHSLHAVLLPRLPLHPGAAVALDQGLAT